MYNLDVSMSVFVKMIRSDLAFTLHESADKTEKSTSLIKIHVL